MIQLVSAGLLTAIVGFASTFAVVLKALASVGATQAQAASGLLALLFATGILAMGLSWRSRMPISIAWSTPGAALMLATGVPNGGFPVAVGAFLVAAVLIVAAGLWRPFGRAVAAIPASLAAAMLAGVLLPLCTAPVKAVAAMPTLALPIVLVWALALRFARAYAVPLAVLVTAIIVFAATPLPPGALADIAPRPVLVMPGLTLDAVIGLAIPLFVVTMASQNLPGLAVLGANGFRPAVGPIFVATGVASGIIAFFGAHSVNLAAITAALCAGPDAHPDPARRWFASFVSGIGYVALTVDAVGLLPDTHDDVRRVSLSLLAACAGVAADVAGARSCDPGSGTLVPRTLDDERTAALPTPGSFASAQTAPCPRAAPDGMVCIEGGLFARGSATFELDETSPSRSVPERLVRLSPFAIDRTEMTVRAMRDLVRKTGIDRPVERSAEAPLCTYTLEPGDFEDYPVNCINRTRAAAACEARGGRLPTEAEWEFAAGDRDQEKRYPWGADPDACSHAIIGRARFPNEGDDVAGSSTACRGSLAGGAPFGPRPVTEGDDVNALGLRHMAGNVGEWMADQFAPYDGHCSEGPTVLVDPRCDRAEQSVFLTRGGAWNQRPYQAQTTYRSTYDGDKAVVQLGFRCAQSL